MSKKTRTLVLSLVVSIAFALGNAIDRYETGRLTLDTAEDLSVETMSCIATLTRQVEMMGREVPTGPLTAFCMAVASAEPHDLTAEVGEVL